MASQAASRNENDERRLLIWQFASSLLSIFAYISVTWIWDVKKTLTPDSAKWRCHAAEPRRQNKSDAPDHKNIKEVNLASAVGSFASLLVMFCSYSNDNELGC
jgi:hypothetical protein